jgi:hypothetical protein
MIRYLVFALALVASAAVSSTPGLSKIASGYSTQASQQSSSSSWNAGYSSCNYSSACPR